MDSVLSFLPLLIDLITSFVKFSLFTYKTLREGLLKKLEQLKLSYGEITHKKKFDTLVLLRKKEGLEKEFKISRKNIENSIIKIEDIFQENRLISLNDLQELGYGDEPTDCCGGCGQCLNYPKTDLVPSWVYNNNYWYWTMPSSNNASAVWNMGGDGRQGDPRGFRKV